jgi:hypothetical protein
MERVRALSDCIYISTTTLCVQNECQEQEAPDILNTSIERSYWTMKCSLEKEGNYHSESGGVGQTPDNRWALECSIEKPPVYFRAPILELDEPSFELDLESGDSVDSESVLRRAWFPLGLRDCFEFSLLGIILVIFAAIGFLSNYLAKCFA